MSLDPLHPELLLPADYGNELDEMLLRGQFQLPEGLVMLDPFQWDQIPQPILGQIESELPELQPELQPQMEQIEPSLALRGLAVPPGPVPPGVPGPAYNLETVSRASSDTTSIDSKNVYGPVLPPEMALALVSPALASSTLALASSLALGLAAPGKKTRSRGGCVSCKKLRIKCGEQKPFCEYCVSTSRECVYIPPKPNRKQQQKALVHRNKLTKMTIKIMDSGLSVSNCTKSLNSLATQLEISLFELKLLHTFKTFCCPYLILTHGPLAVLLTVQAPKYFVDSYMVKQAVFLFSALHVWNIKSEEQDIYLTKFWPFSDEIHAKTNQFDVGDLDLDLKTCTSHYFLNLLSGVNNFVFNGLYRVHRLENEQAIGLWIGTVILFIFLSVHSHNLVPFVKFDENDEYVYDFDQIINLNTDLLTISHILRTLADYINKNFEVQCPKFGPETLSKSTTSPILIQIKQEFQELKMTETETQIIGYHIEVLECVVSAASVHNHPSPMFKFFLETEEPFIQMVREKHLFALRLLNVYSFFCQMSALGFSRHNNLWSNYMTWFKNYNYKHFGGFKYDTDRRLYVTAVETERSHNISTTQLMGMDIFTTYEYIRR